MTQPVPPLKDWTPRDQALYNAGVVHAPRIHPFLVSCFCGESLDTDDIPTATTFLKTHQGRHRPQ